MRRRAEGARLRAVRDLPGCRRSRPAHAARALDGKGRPGQGGEGEQHAAAAPAGAPRRQRRARGLRIQPDAVGTVPRRTAMPDDIVFDGGSQADRREIMNALDAYLSANAAYDWQRLAQIWSHDPTNGFFNMNRHTYVGLAHWTRLWKSSRERVERGWGGPYDIRVLVRPDRALVTCPGRPARRWKGPESERLTYDADRPSFISRSTMVMVKEP